MHQTQYCDSFAPYSTVYLPSTLKVKTHLISILKQVSQARLHIETKININILIIHTTQLQLEHRQNAS